MSVGCREEPTKVLGEKGGGEPEQLFLISHPSRDLSTK